jgi:iduronate 2-sulfatase
VTVNRRWHIWRSEEIKYEKEDIMNRREFLKKTSMVAATVAAGGLARTTRSVAGETSLSNLSRPDHPNVLFIGIDDLCTNISAFDNPKIKTPNMEALARRGMAFTQGYCQFPLCSPSRTSVITGLRPETTGILCNTMPWRERNPDAVSLPQHFSAHGYETILVGKILHGFDNEKGAGWNRMIDQWAGIERSGKKGRELQGVLTDKIKSGQKPVPMDEYYQWGPSGLDGTDEMDGRFAAQAIRVLGEQRDKPFFLAVGFGKPHLPWAAPDRFFDMYPEESVDLPEYSPDGWKDLPEPIRKPPMENLMNKPVTPELVRNLRRSYHACCSFVDHNVGLVLEALKAYGLEENTVVVIWSDNGSIVGEHGYWGKNSMWEEACRVPLIVAAPWMTENAGKKCSRLVELVDIYSTLADLCGLPEAETEGLSMTPLLCDPQRPWKKAVFTTCQDKNKKYIGHGVRTENWRYSEYNGPEHAELYDRIADPGEMNNLAHKKEYAEIADQMRALLKGGWQRALPDQRL